jgi:hypothetical protein
MKGVRKGESSFGFAEIRTESPFQSVDYVDHSSELYELPSKVRERGMPLI